MTFKEFLVIDEGLLLPDQPRWNGMSRITPLPCTNVDRRKLMPKKPPKVEPFKLLRAELSSHFCAEL